MGTCKWEGHFRMSHAALAVGTVVRVETSLDAWSCKDTVGDQLIAKQRLAS